MYRLMRHSTKDVMIALTIGVVGIPMIGIGIVTCMNLSTIVMDVTSINLASKTFLLLVLLICLHANNTYYAMQYRKSPLNIFDIIYFTLGNGNLKFKCEDRSYKSLGKPAVL